MHYYKDRLLLAITRSNKVLIAAKRMKRVGARFKVFTAEVVSLRFVSYSEAKAVTYAQEGVDGTASGGRAEDVSDNEEGVAAQTSCFNID